MNNSNDVVSTYSNLRQTLKNFTQTGQGIFELYSYINSFQSVYYSFAFNENHFNRFLYTSLHRNSAFAQRL